MSLLKVEREGDGPVFVWLHGFTQTSQSAARFRSILTETRELWTLDLPGHGAAATVWASLDECADLVADLLDAPCDLGGYSFGGRVALHVALRHPEVVSRLVLLGATRGIEDASQREDRRRRDDALADHIEAVGADKFLEEWLAQPLFTDLGRDPEELASRSHDPRGLAESLRRCGTGTQAWLGERIRVITAPTLALAGELDHKFTSEARAIAARVQDGTAAVVQRAGHAAHLVQPELTARHVNGFLV